MYKSFTNELGSAAVTVETWRVKIFAEGVASLSLTRDHIATPGAGPESASHRPRRTTWPLRVDWSLVNWGLSQVLNVISNRDVRFCKQKWRNPKWFTSDNPARRPLSLDSALASSWSGLTLTTGNRRPDPDI